MNRYLGDGVYAELLQGGVWLRAGKDEKHLWEAEIFLGHEEIEKLLLAIVEYAL